MNRLTAWLKNWFHRLFHTPKPNAPNGCSTIVFHITDKETIVDCVIGDTDAGVLVTQFAELFSFETVTKISEIVNRHQPQKAKEIKDCATAMIERITQKTEQETKEKSDFGAATFPMSPELSHGKFLPMRRA